MPGMPLLGLVLGVALASGCNTAVGNYFGNRARDFGECFCVDVGGALGLGGGVSASGLLHVGLGGGYSPDRFAFGIEYGQAFAFGARTARSVGDKRVEIWLPGPLPHTGHGPLMSHAASYRMVHGADEIDEHVCAAVLPGLPLTQASEFALKRRWSAVHAWDVEVSVFAGVVFARAGFSPGEFLDFLLGWFGVDIAGDDRSLAGKG